MKISTLLHLNGAINQASQASRAFRAHSQHPRESRLAVEDAEAGSLILDNERTKYKPTAHYNDSLITQASR